METRNGIWVLGDFRRWFIPSGSTCAMIADRNTGASSCMELIRALMLAGFVCLFSVGCGIVDFPPVGPVNPHADDVIVSHEFRCLMIEDVNARGSLPTIQLAMLTGKEVRDFLKANCVKVAGNPEFRIVDQSAKLSGVWADIVAANPPASYPWIILTNGKAVSSKALPNDWDVLTADLNKYAGIK